MGKKMAGNSKSLAIYLLATVSATTVAVPQTATTQKRIVFLGNSLSAGSGVQPKEAFPALIAEKIRARNLPYEVDNAGVGGDTTSGGLRRLDWLQQRKIDVLVLELGGNDGLRGLSPALIKTNLQAIIDKAKAKNPEMKIVLAGMQMPPNLGADYATQFRKLFKDLAETNRLPVVPFLLEGVGGIREVNQPDLIHPTAAGHQIIAETVWKVLEPLL